MVPIGALAQQRNLLLMLVHVKMFLYPSSIPRYKIAEVTVPCFITRAMRGNVSLETRGEFRIYYMLGEII